MGMPDEGRGADSVVEDRELIAPADLPQSTVSATPPARAQTEVDRRGAEFLVLEAPLFVSATPGDEAVLLAPGHWREILERYAVQMAAMSLGERAAEPFHKLSSGQQALAALCLMMSAATIRQRGVRILLAGPERTISTRNAAAIEAVRLQHAPLVSLFSLTSQGSPQPWPAC